MQPPTAGDNQIISRENTTLNGQKLPPNYIIIINWFWIEVPQMNGYKPLYGLLFFSLLDSINKNNWNPTFIDFDRILNKTKITAGPYNDGRKWLMENNIIEFVPGKNAHQMASFSIGLVIRNLTGKLITKHTSNLTGTAMSGLGLNLGLNLYNSKHINSINIVFDDFWNFYDKKKGSKEKSEKLWNALTDEERKKAMEHIPLYKKEQPDKQFRKHPEGYLSNKLFNNEIIKANENTASDYSYPNGNEVASKYD